MCQGNEGAQRNVLCISEGACLTEWMTSANHQVCRGQLRFGKVDYLQLLFCQRKTRLFVLRKHWITEKLLSNNFYHTKATNFVLIKFKNALHWLFGFSQALRCLAHAVWDQPLSTLDSRLADSSKFEEVYFEHFHKSIIIIIYLDVQLSQITFGFCFTLGRTRMLGFALKQLTNNLIRVMAYLMQRVCP